MKNQRKWLSLTVAMLVVAGTWGCKPSNQTSNGTQGGKVVIRIDGSDTMINLAQAWAEEYNRTHPDVSLQVSGGGSGVGIAAMINGDTDLANSSRKMKESELNGAKSSTGKEPKEFVVAKDALAIYVHNDNPLDSITVAKLGNIYGDGGEITSWANLDVKNEGCASDEITRVSRQSNSGTYHYVISW